jgi:hypothetical protein
MARAQRNAVLNFGRAESLNSVSQEDDPTISGSLSLRFLSFLQDAYPSWSKYGRSING